MNNIEEQVKAFIVQETGFKLEKLSLQTRLNLDIGVDGDDAIEFIDKFSELFEVDFSEFKFDRDFGSEGGNPFFLFWSFIMGLFRHSVEDQLEPITIYDLIVAVKAKKWILPTRNV